MSGGQAAAEAPLRPGSMATHTAPIHCQINDSDGDVRGVSVIRPTKFVTFHEEVELLLESGQLQ